VLERLAQNQICWILNFNKCNVHSGIKINIKKFLRIFIKNFLSLLFSKWKIVFKKISPSFNQSFSTFRRNKSTIYYWSILVKQNNSFRFSFMFFLISISLQRWSWKQDGWNECFRFQYSCWNPWESSAFGMLFYHFFNKLSIF
jgi:hypothetical protein